MWEEIKSCCKQGFHRGTKGKNLLKNRVWDDLKWLLLLGVGHFAA